MAIELQVKSLDGLDEGIAKLYQKNDDGYELDISGLDALKNSKNHERDKKKEAEKQAREYKAELDDLSAKLKAIEDKAEQNTYQESKKSNDIDAVEKSWQEKYDKLAAENKAQQDKLMGNLQSVLVDKQATELASQIAVKGSEALLFPHIKTRLGCEERNGEYTTIVLDSSGNPSALTLDELKQEFASNDQFASVIAGTNANGGGAAPNNGGGAALKRSEMSPQETHAYIQKYGRDEYLKLPK